jgi:phosphoenolpyruvate synthase/pyruvate phosphate dikinase
MYIELSAGTSDRVGGKAAGLAKLVALGLPVPPAVVVPVDARGVLDQPDEVARRLGEPLAVRSSALGEDAGDRSAAGQYESLMGVGAADLREAVERVYASASSDRVRAYRGSATADMAVVIQREVAADRAGVAFSVNPLTGADEVVIECVFGHGEWLVSGLANPDRYRVSREGEVEAKVALREGPERILRCLRDDEARAVADLAREAEEGFGQPVDVEFCFEGGALWLVQCRAITTL